MDENGRTPLDERIYAALRCKGFDETDAAYAIEALAPFMAEYRRHEAKHDDAVGAIQDAVLLIGRFDPTCGSARTRTFLSDLENVLRGRSCSDCANPRRCCMVHRKHVEPPNPHTNCILR